MKRVITGLLLVGLVVLNLYLLDVNPICFALFITVITAFCVFELNRALKETMPLCLSVLSYVTIAAMLPCYLLWSQNGILMLICLAFIAGLIMFTARIYINTEALMMFAFILLYPVLLLSLNYEMIYSPQALFLLVAVFGIGPMSDTFAYIVGSTVKGKKLCPEISPKKTVSGAVGGIFGGIAAGVIIYFVFNAFFGHIDIPSLFIMAVLGGIGGIFTAAGDLFESALKRRLNIKDFGGILPGHGGVLDRVDGIIFNSLFMYAFFLMFF